MARAPYVMNIQSCPELYRYDATINHPPPVPYPHLDFGAVGPAEEHLAMLAQREGPVVFGEDVAAQYVSRTFAGKWTMSFGAADSHGRWRDAWLRLRLGHDIDERSTFDVEVTTLYWNRRERWERLCQAHGMPFPDQFRVYRLVRGRAFVDQVVQAWMAPPAPLMRISQHVLSSWGMVPETLVAQFKQNEPLAVLHEAIVSFDDTLADKWVDGGSFIVPWGNQYEVVVGLLAPDTMLVNREAAKVFIGEDVYDHDRRDALIERWTATERARRRRR